MHKMAEAPASTVGRPRIRRSGTMTSLTDSLPLDYANEEDEAAAALHEFHQARSELRRTVSQERQWDEEGEDSASLGMT